MTEIYILLAVLLGYYLGRNYEVKSFIRQIKKYKAKPNFGTPFVVKPREAEIEREQQSKPKKERIFLKDILNAKNN